MLTWRRGRARELERGVSARRKHALHELAKDHGDKVGVGEHRISAIEAPTAEFVSDCAKLRNPPVLRFPHRFKIGHVTLQFTLAIGDILQAFDDDIVIGQ